MGYNLEHMLYGDKSGSFLARESIPRVKIVQDILHADMTAALPEIDGIMRIQSCVADIGHKIKKCWYKIKNTIALKVD